MPQVLPTPRDVLAADKEVFLVTKNGAEREFTFRPPRLSQPIRHACPLEQAHVLDRHDQEVYVHYVNSDKRMDEWVSESCVRPAGVREADGATNGVTRKRKRGSPDGSYSRKGSSTRSSSGVPSGSVHPEGTEFVSASASVSRANASVITEDEFDIEHQKQITAKRNFEKVIFGRWQIRTW